MSQLKPYWPLHGGRYIRVGKFFCFTIVLMPLGIGLMITGALLLIAESLHWIAHCTQAPEQAVQSVRPPAEPRNGGVVMSQFGR